MKITKSLIKLSKTLEQKGLRTESKILEKIFVKFAVDKEFQQYFDMTGKEALTAKFGKETCKHYFEYSYYLNRQKQREELIAQIDKEYPDFPEPKNSKIDYEKANQWYEKWRKQTY